MNLYKRILLLFFMVAFAACEDVIDVPVQSAPARLTVEASLDWEKGTAGNVQTIKLSTSTPFFDTTTNTAVTGALVTVTHDGNGAQVVFADQNNGRYTTNEFVPELRQSYTLAIQYNGETYTAKETLNPLTDITEITQSREDGFNEDDLEVRILFTDPPEEGNNYLFKFQKEGELLPELEVGTDEFINGNEIDWWYEIEEDDETDRIEAFVPGDVVNIEMYSTSEAYNDYLEILIEQVGGVGLFQATPVAVKGNCVNSTNPDNFAHGYFRLTEVTRTSYTFE